MAIDVDGIAVLRAIAENPFAFPDVTAEMNQVARKLVVKQLKARSTTLELVRKIHSAIGGEAFVLILDDLGDAAGALVKKLDKDNSDLAIASPEWRRKRIAALASGAAVSVMKTAKPAPAKKAEKSALSPEQKALKEALTKAKSLANARDLWREAGGETFMIVLGGLTDKQKQTLAKKLDKDNPNLAEFSSNELRERIADLASGRAEPVFKNIMESASLAAVGRRKTK